MLTNFARACARDLLNAIAQTFLALGLSPNALTIAGFIGMCLIAVVIAAGYEVVAGVLIIFAGMFDATDGALARLSGRVTPFGAFLDSTLDRWAEGALFIAITARGVQLQNTALIYLPILALLGSLMVSYTRARAEGLGLQMKEGWFTRLERMLVLTLGLILTAFFGATSLVVAVAIIALLANSTALQRILATRRLLKQ